MIALPVRERVEKILRLALCPAAPEGEWQSAAYALIRTLRASGTKPEELLSAPARATAYTAVSSSIMRFGKYRDRTVRWIVENDPSYAEWLVRKVTNLGPSLRQEFRSDLKERYGDFQQGESK